MTGFLTACVQAAFIPAREHAMRVRVWITFLAALAAFCAGCGGGSSHPASSTTSARTPPRTSATDPPPPRRPLALRFERAGRLPIPLQLPAVAALGTDGALVMGGLDQVDGSSSAILRVSGSAARQAGNLPTALHDAAAATIGSRTLFIGGGNGGSSSSAINLISPGGVTTHLGSLPVGASDVAAAALGDAIYVVGGYDGSKPLDTIVRVTPAGRARVVAHMPRPLRYAAVAAAADGIVIAGGTVGTDATDTVLRFDPTTHKVKRIGRLTAPVTHAAAVAVGDETFVIGGRGSNVDSQRATVLAVNPVSGRVRRAGHRRCRCRTSRRWRLAAACSCSAAWTRRGKFTTRSGRPVPSAPRRTRRGQRRGTSTLRTAPGSSPLRLVTRARMYTSRIRARPPST